MNKTAAVLKVIQMMEKGEKRKKTKSNELTVKKRKSKRYSNRNKKC